MQKPKICFVSPKMNYLLTKNSHLMGVGGAELQQLLIGKELVRRGYEVSIITNNSSNEKIKTIGSFKVISIFKSSECIPFISFFYTRFFRLWQALCASDADIYYVRSAGYKLAPIVLFAKLNRKKVIFCGADDSDFNPQSVQLQYWRDRKLFFWGLKTIWVNP